MESRIYSLEIGRDSASPTNVLLRLAKEGKPEKVSKADVPTRSATKRMNTGLGVPNSRTEYQLSTLFEINGTHLLDDEAGENPAPSTRFRASSACCATGQNSVHASPEWAFEKDPRTGRGPISNSPQAESDDRCHHNGARISARKDLAQPGSGDQPYSKIGHNVENLSQTISESGIPAIALEGRSSCCM